MTSTRLLATTSTMHPSRTLRVAIAVLRALGGCYTLGTIVLGRLWSGLTTVHPVIRPAIRRNLICGVFAGSKSFSSQSDDLNPEPIPITMSGWCSPRLRPQP